jgi:hypothetical protein
MKSTEYSGCYGSSFPGYLLVVSDIIVCRDLMCGNTYKLLVEVDIPLHNVPVIDNCDISLVLCLVQKLLLIVLHLCSLLYLLLVHYTKALNYTTWCCNEVVLHCTLVVRYCMVATQYYIVAT